MYVLIGKVDMVSLSSVRQEMKLAGICGMYRSACGLVV